MISLCAVFRGLSEGIQERGELDIMSYRWYQHGTWQDRRDMFWVTKQELRTQQRLSDYIVYNICFKFPNILSSVQNYLKPFKTTFYEWYCRTVLLAFAIRFALSTKCVSWGSFWVQVYIVFSWVCLVSRWPFLTTRIAFESHCDQSSPLGIKIALSS